METRPKSTFEIRRNNINDEYLNIYNEKEINQSPKIYSNKIRDLKEEKKLFSLIDINHKITNSKGTSLPMQYKRLTPEEINKYFHNDKLVGWSYDRPLINKYKKRIKETITSLNSKKIYDKKDLPNIGYKVGNNSNIKNVTREQIKKKESISKSEIIENKDNLSQNNINRRRTLNSSYSNVDGNRFLQKREITHNISSAIPTRNRNQSQDNKNQIYILPTKRNDSWMPKNYKNYELLVKNPNLLFLKLKEDSLRRKIPFDTSKEISKKMYDSDVFFVKDKKMLKEVYPKKNNSTIYTNSDILCIKKDTANLSKCGETYLFKSFSKNKYTPVNESNSKWEPSSNLPNLMNYTSKEFNIINPEKKSNSKTRSKIIEESKIRFKNNNYIDENNKNSFFNPTHKQKGISEFIDITQNGSGNPGREFVKSFKDNSLCFHKNSDVCATFGDAHLDYKNICTRPFVKEKFFNI